MTNKVLLYKFFKGETSQQEEVEIKQWMEESKRNEATFYQERLLYDATLLNKGTLENIPNSNKPKRMVFWNSFIRVAAIFLLITTVGLLINKYNKDINATYPLHTVTVPPGQRINLVLADNSSIWLNSNTTFKYPSQFSKKQREVYLDGEAYFEVSANEKQPFIVNTHQGGVKVTGTTFNVSAYSKFDKFETSLLEGVVGVYLKRSLYKFYLSTLSCSSATYSKISPGWQSSTLQIASKVENRMAFALLVLSTDRLAAVISTSSASSLERIFRLANITSRFTIMAIIR